MPDKNSGRLFLKGFYLFYCHYFIIAYFVAAFDNLIIDKGEAAFIRPKRYPFKFKVGPLVFPAYLEALKGSLPLGGTFSPLFLQADGAGISGYCRGCQLEGGSGRIFGPAAEASEEEIEAGIVFRIFTEASREDSDQGNNAYYRNSHLNFFFFSINLNLTLVGPFVPLLLLYFPNHIGAQQEISA